MGFNLGFKGLSEECRGILQFVEANVWVKVNPKSAKTIPFHTISDKLLFTVIQCFDAMYWCVYYQRR